jgi:hypothetical protein
MMGTVEKLYGVGEAARRLRARRTRDLSDLMTRGVIPEGAYVLVSGRRLIKESFFLVIQGELMKRGWTKPQAELAAEISTMAGPGVLRG